MVSVVAPALALCTLLPQGPAWICALVAIIVFGVPHGALDGEMARNWLRPRYGAAWFVVFATPYLFLVALVLVLWRVAPIATLAGFLTLSVWHFGEEEAPARSLEAVVRGGLPIAMPVMAHPLATLAVLSGIAAAPIDRVPDWLWLAALAWLATALVWAVRTIWRGEARALLTPAVLVGLFIVLPPLIAFTIYFICVHAPAHTAAVIRDRVHAPRVRSAANALRYAVPLTIAAWVIGACLWPWYGGQAPMRLLGVTLQLLAALTLPHMLFGYAVIGRTNDGEELRPSTPLKASALS